MNGVAYKLKELNSYNRTNCNFNNEILCFIKLQIFLLQLVLKVTYSMFMDLASDRYIQSVLQLNQNKLTAISFIKIRKKLP